MSISDIMATQIFPENKLQKTSETKEMHGFLIRRSIFKQNKFLATVYR